MPFLIINIKFTNQIIIPQPLNQIVQASNKILIKSKQNQKDKFLYIYITFYSFININSSYSTRYRLC